MDWVCELGMRIGCANWVCWGECLGGVLWAAAYGDVRVYHPFRRVRIFVFLKKAWLHSLIIMLGTVSCSLYRMPPEITLHLLSMT